MSSQNNQVEVGTVLAEIKVVLGTSGKSETVAFTPGVTTFGEIVQMSGIAADRLGNYRIVTLDANGERSTVRERNEVLQAESVDERVVVAPRATNG